MDFVGKQVIVRGGNRYGLRIRQVDSSITLHCGE